MRGYVTIISVMMAVLVTVVAGCGGAARYDGRLSAADSLMRSAPDSALAIVQAVDRDSLATAADRAYHDLLLTQARYRCYVTATSDSDINRAVDYYLAHSGECEKLTRALLYKGAVMEELGHPDSAMIYYKHAESTAAPDDYFNLGYINMRIAFLYGNFFEMDGKEIKEYEEALEYFNRSDDQEYQLKCLNNLGCLLRATQPQKAESLLKRASAMAVQIKDTTSLISNIHSLIILYYYNQNLIEARRQVQQLGSFPDTLLYYDLCFCAANVYSKLGLIDSAEYFFNLGKMNHIKDDALYKMYYLGSLAELSAARNDTLAYLKYSRKSSLISDSLVFNNDKIDISRAEAFYDKRTMNNIHDDLSFWKRFLKWLIVAIFIVIIISLWIYYNERYNYRRLISDLKLEIKSQSVNLATFQHNTDKLKIKDSELKEFIESHNDMLRKVIEECYHTPHGPLAKSIKQIVKYNDRNANMWNKLFDYLDMEYNNIMSQTQKRYPQLDNKELLMIALTCMGYSCAQIAIVLDYSSSAGISTIRKRIARKMGFNGLLADYIKQFQY